MVRIHKDRLTPIVGLYQITPTKWSLASELLGQPDLIECKKVWWQKRYEMAVRFHPGVWRWPSIGHVSGQVGSSLFNFKTVHIYRLLVQKCKKKNRGMIVPKWCLSSQAQQFVVEYLWECLGVCPKVWFTI